MHRWFFALGLFLAAGCTRTALPVTPSVPRSSSDVTPMTTAALDTAMNKYMASNHIRAGQLAIVRGGKVLFSRGYTKSNDPSYPKTTPTSIMRIASESKAFSYLAGMQVVNDGLVARTKHVFAYLQVGKPLLSSQHPDQQINAITVDQLLNFTSGISGEQSSTNTDPAGPGPVRSAEIGAGNSGPLSIAQFTRYLYGYPLQSAPGTTYNNLTNAGYYLINRIVSRASGKPYWTYVQNRFLTPINIHDAVLTRTAAKLRHAGEVKYDSNLTNPSVLDPKSNAQVPCPYGGNFLYEVIDPAAVAISTQSYARFIDKYYSPYYSTASYWTGFMCGSSSYTGFQKGKPTYSFTFNKALHEFGPADPFVKKIAALVKKLYP